MMPILEILIAGTLLGWGAAIPIGPINLELIRRNLQFGTTAGLCFGLGAATADCLFLILLSVGALSLLTQPVIFKMVGLLGAIILAYFGYRAFTIKPISKTHLITGDASLPKEFLSGLFLTVSSPISIIFWASISTQVVALTLKHPLGIIYAGIGVIFGTTTWIVALNLFMHFTKHKISDRAIHILNKIGGVILLGFAVFSFYYSFFK